MSLGEPRAVTATYFVVPSGIDDPTRPSGGNTYDRRVSEGLRVIPVADPAGLAVALAGLPDGATVLLDGLVAAPAPEVVAPAAARLRLVVLVHLPLADETGRPRAEAARLDARERDTLRAADAVVATSAWAGRRLVRRHDLPAARVHVVAPGVDPAPLATGTDGVSGLLCVAAVIPRKGHDLLVQALPAELTCACAGALDRAPDYVASLPGGGLRLLGPRTGPALDAAYDRADLLVLPSRAETYGMVVTEALARGIPVLATDVGGVPEALGTAPDGTRPGQLVAPSVPALREALGRWLTRPDLRTRWRDAARARRATLTGWAETRRNLAAVLARVPVR